MASIYCASGRSDAIGRLRPPLNHVLADALTCPCKRQSDESAATDSAYRAGLADLGWYYGGEYMITGELGIPVQPGVLGRVRATAPEGRPLRRGLHAENLRPRTARRRAPGHSRSGQDPQDRLETVRDPTFRLPPGRSLTKPNYGTDLRIRCRDERARRDSNPQPSDP